MEFTLISGTIVVSLLNYLKDFYHSITEVIRYLHYFQRRESRLRRLAQTV